MLESELIKDGKIDTSVLRQICNVFEGGEWQHSFWLKTFL
jgi:hypothetical protein